jgi:hypothetical protein
MLLLSHFSAMLFALRPRVCYRSPSRGFATVWLFKSLRARFSWPFCSGHGQTQLGTVAVASTRPLFETDLCVSQESCFSSTAPSPLGSLQYSLAGLPYRPATRRASRSLNMVDCQHFEIRGGGPRVRRSPHVRAPARSTFCMRL